MSVGGAIRRNIYWLNDYLKGSPVGFHLKDIREILSDKDTGLLRQRQYIEDLLGHVTKNTEFYNGCKGKTIDEYPVVNKMVLVNNYEQLLVDHNNIPGQHGNIHIQKTSGSTGTPMCIPQDTRKRNRRIAELKYFGEFSGYKSHEKLAQLRVWTSWQNKTKIQSFRENIYPVNCSLMSDSILKNICVLIEEKKVQACLGYASWFDLLVKYLEKEKYTFKSLKTVIACSEMLNPETRAKLKEFIGCVVVSRYSNEEQGILGQEHIFDEKFYLNHASYYFEMLKLDSDEKQKNGMIGRIVVTDLFNYAFPLIRYDTGDTGILTEGNGKSNGYPVLDKLYGRRLDLILSASGEPVHPMSFTRILKNYIKINQWQFIQKDINNYLLKINGATGEYLDHCLFELKNLLGTEAIISIEFVDDIPVLASGKRKSVVSEMHQ